MNAGEGAMRSDIPSVVGAHLDIENARFRPFSVQGIGREEVGAIVLACESEVGVGLPNALVEVIDTPQDLIDVLRTLVSHETTR